MNNINTLSSSFGYLPSIVSTMTERGISPAAKIDKINTPPPILINAPNEDVLERPNYTNAMSRLNYVKKFGQKYGSMMQGRGDTVLNVNEVPFASKNTAKNISTKIGSQYNIDPALLYASSSEEGMNELFSSKATGLDSKNRKPTDFGYKGFYGDKDFPVNGGQSFGLQTFADRFPELVKRGYLPKEFANQFRGAKAEGQWNRNDFKSPDAAMQAKAAMLKYHYDDVDKYAKQNGIELSPKARDFFALAEYNGGEGAKKMIQEYSKQGLLKGDRFLRERPASSLALKDKPNLDIWDHVVRRMKMADALKREKYFD